MNSSGASPPPEGRGDESDSGASELPGAIEESLNSLNEWERFAVVQPLLEILNSGDPQLSLAARRELEGLEKHDDNDRVRSAARDALAAVAEPEGAEEDPVLARVIDAGMRPGPGLKESARLGAGADRVLLTSGAFLWALTRWDPQVRSALSDGGVELDALAHMLGLRRDPEWRNRFVLDADLETAIETDLASRTAGDVIGPTEMAAAIISSAIVDDTAQLGHRLRNLGADLAAILKTLQTPPVPPKATEALHRVRDVSARQFGIQLSAADVELGDYFPREVDVELDAALRTEASAIIVVAPLMSGAPRSVYEALRRVRPDDFLLLARELAAADPNHSDWHDPDLDRLLAKDADLVWIPDPYLWTPVSPSLWERLGRHPARTATLVAVVRPEAELDLISAIGDQELVVMVRMDIQLTEEERSRTKDLYGRALTTISQVIRAASQSQTRRRANYAADSFDALGPLNDRSDDLGIRADVEMLAALIASKQVIPPLSVGIFGQWGSGKSFMMHQLRLRIMDYADRSRQAGDTSPSAFCTEVVRHFLPEVGV